MIDEKSIARLITDAVVRRPALWRLLRGRMRKLEAWVDFKLRMMGVLPQRP